MYEINARPTSWHTPNSFASRLSFVCITHCTVLEINSTTCYRSATVAAIEYIYTAQNHGKRTAWTFWWDLIWIYSIVRALLDGAVERVIYTHCIVLLTNLKGSEKNKHRNKYLREWFGIWADCAILMIAWKKNEKYVSINEFVWIWRNAKMIIKREQKKIVAVKREAVIIVTSKTCWKKICQLTIARGEEF